MLVLLTAFALCSFSGFLVADRLGSRAPFAVKVSTGIITLVSAAGLSSFGAACITGLTQWPVVAAVVILLLPCLRLVSKDVRDRLSAQIRGVAARPRLSGRVLLEAAVYGGLLLVLGAAFASGMYSDASGLYTASANNIGDLPFHLKVVTSFCYGNNFPPEHPLFAGTRFAYPFLIDYVSAVFVYLGVDMRSAMLLPNLILLLAALRVFQQLTFELTANWAAGILAPVLLVFSGGLGWVVLPGELVRSGDSLLSFLRDLPHDYTISGNSIWRWGNSVTTLFIPQRSLVLGLGLALVTLRQCLPATRGFPGEPDPTRMAAGGLMTGMLPLVHAHTFLVVVAVAVCHCLSSHQRRAWLPYFAVAVLAASPQLVWIASGNASRAGAFVGLHAGWDHGSHNIAWFWMVNTGGLMALAVLALIVKDRGEPLVRNELLLYYVPFAMLFLGANVFRLAPWVWDNIKVLFYWSVGTIPFAARLLSHLLARRRWLFLGYACIAVLTLSGVLDVWRMISRTASFQEFDRDGLELASVIRQETPSDAVVLHAPAYNSPALLAGRRSILGYTGILWSHGLDYSGREADVRAIYAGSENSDALLRRHGVDYILVGVHERNYTEISLPALQRYRKLIDIGSYAVYAVNGK